MTCRGLGMTGLMIVTMAGSALARPQYARNCNDCHFGGPADVGVPEVVGFDAMADPDETLTGAVDRGLLKVFTAAPGETVDLSVLIDFGDATGTRFAAELKRMELAGVVNGGTLTFDADADWFFQTGTEFPDLSAPYYTIPEDSGMSFTAAQTFTFSMLVGASTTPDYYDLEFAVAGQPGFHYNDEHFYLHVTPEPAAIGLLLLGLGVASRRPSRV